MHANVIVENISEIIKERGYLVVGVLLRKAKAFKSTSVSNCTEVLLVNFNSDGNFVQAYAEQFITMLLKNELSWDETAFLFRLMWFIDNNTHIVISPSRCFDANGNRLTLTPNVPANVAEIVTCLCKEKRKKAIIRIVESLCRKGFLGKASIVRG